MSAAETYAPPTHSSSASEDDALRTCYAMLALVTLIILARVAVHSSKRKSFQAQDFFIYFAYADFTAFCSLYVLFLAPLKRVNGVTEGTIQPYPTMTDDLGYMARTLFAAQQLFYLSVFSVKLSLLCLYRKLLIGLPNLYNKIWWSMFIFCIISYIGTIVSSLTVCLDWGPFFARAECGNNPVEDRRTAISLHLNYALNVVTDLMVLALPIWLVWNLQMPRREKMAVGTLFSSGFVCIFFATMRVVQVGWKDGKSQVPKPEWQIIWTVVEAATALIIGVAPAFTAIIRTRLLPSYDSKGYIKHHSPPGDVNLRTIGSASTRPKKTVSTTADDDTAVLEAPWDECYGSREGLAKKDMKVVSGEER